MSIKGNNFIKDIFIYGIGNIGAKLIAFLLVPLYTYYITPDAFGTYDVYLSLIFLLIPFITFGFRDGTFRLLLEYETISDKKNIITYTYKVIFRNILIGAVLYFFISIFFQFDYAIEAFIMLAIYSIYEVEIQILRGLNLIKYYVYIGIISTFATTILTILFLVYLDMGVEGIFIANSLARFLCLIFIEYKCAILKTYFDLRIKNTLINKVLLKYSLPLLPNVTCWWLLSFSNRIIILSYLGADENGIYAVTIKFAAILETFSTIIYQAWQGTAISQYNKEGYYTLFSKIFNNYIFYLSSLLIVLLLSLKLLIPHIIDSSYESCIPYIYPAFISVFFYAMSAFLDLGYQCSKETVKMLPSIFIASAINIGLSILLVNYWHVYGIIIASICSYFILFIYRIYDTRKYLQLSFQYQVFLSFIVLLVGGGLYYFVDSIWILGLCIILFICSSIFLLPIHIKHKLLKLIQL